MFDVVRCQGHMEHGADEHTSRRLLGLMFYLNDIKNKGVLAGLNKILLANQEQVIYTFGQQDGHIAIMEYLLQQRQNI